MTAISLLCQKYPEDFANHSYQNWSSFRFIENKNVGFCNIVYIYFVSFYMRDIAYNLHVVLCLSSHQILATSLNCCIS